MKKLIRVNSIDIVYSNTASVLVGALVARECKVKHVWHLHEIIQKPVMFSKMVGLLLNNYSDKIIVVSDEVKKHWALHVNPEKMLTIHNGLNYSDYLAAPAMLKTELGLSEAQVLIGMIGRVNQWKGQSYFLEIIERLAPKYPTARFLFVGNAYPGNEHLDDELNAKISKEPFAGCVYNLGFRTDIPMIMASLDIFVLPSILPDPLPTVVLEAMASARPVVATRHGGALEMVDAPSTGVLIPWDDAVMAESIIAALIDDAGLRTRMGKAGKERVQRDFSLQQYELNIVKVINALG